MTRIEIKTAANAVNIFALTVAMAVAVIIELPLAVSLGAATLIVVLLADTFYQ